MTYDELYAILPCIILGILCGLVSYYKENDSEYDKNFTPKNKTFKGAFFASASASIISFTIFAILDITDFSYIAKLGISSLVAFIGFDSALNIIERFFNMRKSK